MSFYSFELKKRVKGRQHKYKGLKKHKNVSKSGYKYVTWG
jgi:hypothetical protein